MSDTPRTDEMESRRYAYDIFDGYLVPASFARELEKELNAKDETIKKYQDYHNLISWMDYNKNSSTMTINTCNCSSIHTL